MTSSLSDAKKDSQFKRPAKLSKRGPAGGGEDARWELSSNAGKVLFSDRARLELFLNIRRRFWVERDEHESRRQAI